jgi:hypothetical protein
MKKVSNKILVGALVLFILISMAVMIAFKMML